MPQALPVKRDATWDIARGIGMALVIYGHLLEPIYPAHNGRQLVESAATQWQIIYSFHMMLFFLVSGAVNRSLPKKAWPDVLRASLRLLALAWIVHIIGAIFGMIINPEARSSLSGAAWAIVDPILEGYLWSVGVLWFLTALCFVQLLAYATLRYIPALAVVLVAMIATAITTYLPSQYLMKTWLPGLSFFALGYLFSQWQVRWSVWAAIPLFVLTVLFAPLNHGCSFSFSEVCGTVPFGIRMFAGSYGFLPMFFLSSLVGSLTVVCLSAGFAKFSFSNLLAYMGRNSLELFVINGFVATFLFGTFWQMEWPSLTLLHYAALFVGVIGAHLLALQVLKPVLAQINQASIWVAGFITRMVAGADQKAQPKTV